MNSRHFTLLPFRRGGQPERRHQPAGPHGLLPLRRPEPPHRPDRPLGATTYYLYDAAGRQIALIDPLGSPTYFQYDVRGQQIAVTDALGNTSYFAYDAAGQLTTRVDQRGCPSTSRMMKMAGRSPSPMLWATRPTSSTTRPGTNRPGDARRPANLLPLRRPWPARGSRGRPGPLGLLPARLPSASRRRRWTPSATSLITTTTRRAARPPWRTPRKAGVLHL